MNEDRELLRALEWRSLCGLVSMDRVTPLLPYLGLAKPWAGSVRQVLRDALDEVALQPGSPDWSYESVDRILEAVRSGVGAHEYDAFITWVQEVYNEDPQANPAWFAYAVYFNAWDNMQATDHDPHHVFEDANSIYPLYKTMVWDRFPAALIEACRREPVSERDAKIIALCGFTLDEAESWKFELADPLVTIRLVVRQHLFQTFWTEFLPGLSEVEAARLRDAVTRFVRDREMEIPDPPPPKGLELRGRYP